MSGKLSRRTLMAATTGAGLAAGLRFRIPGNSSSTGTVMRSLVPLPAPYTCTFQVPDVVSPRSQGAFKLAHLDAKVAEAEILPGRTTIIWGYRGTLPGPTLDVRQGEPFHLELTNRLPVATVLHLHGGHTPADSDGYPTDLTQPLGWSPAGHSGQPMSTMNEGDSRHGMKGDPLAKVTVGHRTYAYPQTQSAATFWYHDHTMGFTGRNVWHGLAGMVINHDTDDDNSGLPTGEHDLPVILSDRAFGADAEITYPALDPTGTRPGVQEPYAGGLLGDLVLVNGVPNPWHPVSNGLYRLRVLNASNARRYRLTLSDKASGAALWQVGTDVGMLPQARRMRTIDMAPGQRTEALLDLRSVRMGQDVELVNLFADTRHTRDLVKFKVVRRVTGRPEVPRSLRAGIQDTATTGLVRRSFRFRNDGDVGWTVNGEPFDPTRTLVTVKANSSEIWTFVTDMHHPIHLHQANMRILRRGTNEPRPEDAGWRDTIDVRPAEGVEALVTFGPNRGRFVFHCHNLEHEDMDMMANFRIV